MVLIIAEKPSLARNIASAIGSLARRDGYLEGEGYLVTWAFGHLFSLCDIEHYQNKPEKSRWTMQGLPCFPEPFEFSLRRDKDGGVDAGVKKQFDTITRLCHREDVTQIVNAGDADREGEIIIRLCIRHAKAEHKSLLRLWLPDQTAETVRAALSELKKESEYDNLAAEGYARTYMDWLYGVNLTRFATLHTGTLLRVGRVIVPIVKAIYDRDLAIENFTPETYWAVGTVTPEGEAGLDLVSKKKFHKDEKKKAEEYAELLNRQICTVKERKAKKDKLGAGKLYSLSKLQNALGKKYKMPMDESLKWVQSLYEKGYVTYPRTNSEYLATAEKDKVKGILAALERVGYPVTFKDAKTIFDDKKIESHSALTPTHKIPSKDALTEGERTVYQAILRRFVAVFCKEDCICEKTEMVIAAGDVEDFTLKGTVILEKGWTRFDDTTRNDKFLPPYRKGDVVDLHFGLREKETSPPKHYTIETLNNYLKNPFREEKQKAEEEDDTEDYKAMFEGLELGTEATRTGIIENAIKSRYIQLKKDVYTILPDGRYLIEQLSLLGISMDKFKTATTGKALKSVFRGQMSIEQAVDVAKNEIAAVFSDRKGEELGYYGDPVGTCPLCGGEVVKGKYSYGCKNYKEGCRFGIRLQICSRAIPIGQARKLLSGGVTDELAGFVSRRTGKSFSARLKLQDGRAVFDFSAPQNASKG